MLLENIEVMVIIKPLTMTFNLFQNQLPQPPLPPKPLLKPPVLKAKQTSILCMMILKRN